MQMSVIPEKAPAEPGTETGKPLKSHSNTIRRVKPMKTIVIYNSQTGFTKRYAQWISEAAGADCLALSAAKKENLTDYEAIIFGSWACAGGISKIGWFKGNIDKWADKKLIAYCVGASPAENPEIETALKQNFSETERKKVKAFYCPGGFNYEKMPAPSRLMMKMFIKALKSKKNKTEQEQAMVKMISSSYDISDKKYIEPILQYLRE
jgi:menaquinone-dependent protoporphyrinogen IX oxidase